ncbi:aminoglycoside phosphotransferase family protein [Streptomyces yaizuensis]|uniref:Phosphotransferase n=1 Tax=Streptomyces yaizuensis TaxID=2989713 RepID=A0ABQ5NSI2_9ACTN|nr:aminoglycoside phosphotransferase family protein [Streptomyces sp. YSPA8]GLF93327.1 phosphotransferase [Streptomyces sp. YSPA8]
MRERPRGDGAPGDTTVLRALRAWDVDAARVEYAPVGFGDHHWTATAPDGERWFVTVSDLSDKPHCGPGTASARDGLSRAMDTARALRERAGLGFVVAPLPTRDGRTLLPLGERYAVALFPHLPGATGEFGRETDPARRMRTVEILAALHRAPVPGRAPVLPSDPAGRAGLERSLGDLGVPWTGGPLAEPARELLAGTPVARRLAEYDLRARDMRRRGVAPVLTHGEPHPGNVLWQGTRPLLLDWDTTAVAPPERDLWQVALEPGELDRWTELTGRAPDAGALALYELRWDLEDIASCVAFFRSPHAPGADADLAREGFARAAGRLATG